MDSVTFLGSPSVVGAKTWTTTPEGPQARAYTTGEGPFVARVLRVADLPELAALVAACPSNAFVVRGAPVAPTIPYRRHRERDGAPPSLLPQAHRWLAVDVDAPGPVPRSDLPAAASEARALLPEPFRGAQAFACATSSAGVVPGIRVRLWFWLSREISDDEAKRWLDGTIADTHLYTPSQPCYCAAPTFEEGVTDPFADTSRTCWLDGAPEVQVPEAFDRASDPLKGFGAAAAGAVVGNRNAHLASLAGSMRRRGADATVIAAALHAANGQLADALPAHEVDAIARSIARYAPEPPAPEGAPEAPARGDWSARAIVNDEGGLVPCAENFSLLLRGHPAFALWLNSRTGKPVWERCPWRASHTPVADGDDFQMRCWLSRHIGWHKLPCDALAGIAEVAAARPYDPWRGWLDSLAWDRTPRLETAAKRLLGDASAVAAITFAWWMISAVARSHVPGVQADHMIVLEGAQGAGKTTFLRELAMHEAFFTRLSAHSDLSNVRTIGKIHGPVIVELAELDTVRRAGTEAMKAFIDERVDRVQWLYARTQVDVPRSCVFAGTSNDSSYLKDATGNRRYWPIACSRIDLEALRAEREQLWAEAAAAYRAGAVWWPASEMIGELAELQESRRAVSAAEETISSVLEATYTPGLHVLSGAVLHANQVLDGKLLWVTTTQLCALAKCKDFEVQTAMHAIKWKMGRVRLLTGQRIRAYMREVNEGT